MFFRNSLSARWWKLGVASKFGVAFTSLIFLIVLVSIMSQVLVFIVSREEKAASLTGVEIQRLVLKMDNRLEKARRLENEFFLTYPTDGFSVARQTYDGQVQEQITELVIFRAELQQLIAQSDVSDALRATDIDLNFYLSAANRFSDTFDEAVTLVALLADEETGLQPALAQQSSSLAQILEASGDAELMILYREMQLFEKDYFANQKRPFMQSAFNTAVSLRQAILQTTGLSTEEKEQATQWLDSYLATAAEILTLDVAIRSKTNEFDLQAEALEPISLELLELANDEVQRADARIAQVNQLAFGIFLFAVVICLLLAIFIANLMNKSVMNNIVALTAVAREIQDGNLHVRADIYSGDELGQLADGFNEMAVRLDFLIGNLELQVAERTAALLASNEQLHQEITQHKQTEATLRKREAQYRGLVEHMSSGVAVYEAVDDGKDFIFKEFNLAGEKIEGISRQNIIGERLLAAFPGAKQMGLFDVLQTVWRTGDSAYLPQTLYPDELNLNTWRENRIYKLPSGEVVAVYNDITERVQAAETLRQYTQQLETMQRITAVLSTSLSLEEVLTLILEQLGLVVPFDSMTIFLYEGEQAKIAIAKGANQEQLIGHSFPANNALFQEIQTTCQSLCLEDAQVDARFQNRGEVNVRGWMGVPLLVKDELIGFLTLDSFQSGIYRQTEVALVRPFADQAAQAIENASLHGKIQRHAVELEERVRERTEKLSMMVNAMAGREVRMADLKKVIQKLRAQLEAVGIKPVANDPFLGDQG